jgi:predicted nucleotidyltransferase
MPDTVVYDADERLRTRRVTRDLIEYVVDKIVNAVKPRQVILFGSFARGDANESSDLDLLVVHEGGKSNRQVRREIERLLWGRLFGIDLIVRRPEDVARNLADGNPFYTHHIYGQGEVLYEQSGPSAR